MIKFLFGRPGTGKTTRVVEEIKALAAAENRPVFLIVPEQQAYSAERDVLAVLPASVGRSLSILSFSRLCDVVADLYCGIGTIGLSVAKKADISRLVGVEIIPDAVKNAKKNAEINGIKNASFYCGDANDPHIDGCNVIFVDPPRKGLSKELIERIGELGPDKVIYISCGVDTFARDLRLFKELGYETDTVYPYDMFPRTAHVECLACLVRQLDGNI